MTVQEQKQQLADEKYPEHAKMMKVQDKSQTIGAFLDWLRNEGIEFCTFNRKLPLGGQFDPIHRSIEDWLAIYFEVDLTKIELEKRLMLDNLRQMNKRKPTS